MQIELRFAQSKIDPTKKEKKPHITVTAAETVLFKIMKELIVSIFPIPEWFQNPQCKCGEPAKYLLVDMTPICIKCLITMFYDVNKKVKEIDTSIPITMDIISHSRFEWSTDGERWYSIWGKNIKPEKPNLFLEEMRQSTLNNKPILLECDYDKESKSMKVY